MTPQQRQTQEERIILQALPRNIPAYELKNMLNSHHWKNEPYPAYLFSHLRNHPSFKADEFRTGKVIYQLD